jgi:NADH-quinone oxidoreductase subunit N
MFMENLVQTAIANVNFSAIMPSLILICFGMALLLIGVFSRRGRTTHIAWISVIGLAITAAYTYVDWRDAASHFGFAGHVAQDNFAVFFNVIFIAAAVLTILISDDYLKREGYPISEYYALILFTTAGAMWMASGTDMMTIFLGLEVLSISLYVLAGLFRGMSARTRRVSSTSCWAPFRPASCFTVWPCFMVSPVPPTLLISACSCRPTRQQSAIR